jgi:hypothetical protein
VLSAWASVSATDQASRGIEGGHADAMFAIACVGARFEI